MFENCDKEFYSKQKAVLKKKYSHEAFQNYISNNCSKCKYYYGLCMKNFAIAIPTEKGGSKRGKRNKTASNS